MRMMSSTQDSLLKTPIHAPAKENSAVVQSLLAHGINAAKVRKKCPTALNQGLPRIKVLMDFFATHSLDFCKTVNKDPRTLGLRPDTMLAKIAWLGRINVNSEAAVAMFPQLLTLRVKSMQAKVDLLHTLGLDASKIVQRFPVVLGLNTTSVRNRFIFVENLGLDAIRTIEGCPQVLSYCETAIIARIKFLKDVGLDARQIIRAQPTLLGRDINRRLLPNFQFITEDMGRTFEDIVSNPICLGYSLERRIQPRHRYLMLHGRRKDYSLGTFLNCSDEHFVKLTNQTLTHYRQWLTVVN
jgi:hypothetical protein